MSPLEQCREFIQRQNSVLPSLPPYAVCECNVTATSDPDGELLPLSRGKRRKDVAAEEALTRARNKDRDAALVRALRFT